MLSIFLPSFFELKKNAIGKMPLSFPPACFLSPSITPAFYHDNPPSQNNKQKQGSTLPYITFSHMGQTEKPEAAEPPSLSRSDTPAGGIAPAPPTPPSEEGKALLNGESDAPATPPPPSSSGGDDDDDGVPEKSSPSPSEETDHPDTPRPNLGAASSGAAAAKKKPKRKRVDRSIIPKPSVLRVSIKLSPSNTSPTPKSLARKQKRQGVKTQKQVSLSL